MRGKTRGWRCVCVCVCVCVSGSGNGQQGGGMWNISDAGPEAVYTVSQPVTSESRLYKCQQTQDGAVSKQLHRSHHTVTQVSETDWAPSATRALMDRLLCDCVIALAVLLCVATQVRPAPAYLQYFVVDGWIMCCASVWKIASVDVQTMKWISCNLKTFFSGLTWDFFFFFSVWLFIDKL